MSVFVDILNTYYMAGLWKGLSPVPSFFKDRYFPTEAGDIYAADKVLVEYQDGDHGMAPFMVERADPIAVARQPYEIHDYAPLYLSQSRPLTADELKKRGFGEAILSNSTEEERAAKLVSDDLALLERRFIRAEELLCANTMLNNGFTVNEMLDANTVGNVATVQYYDPNKGNDGIYTIPSADRWTTSTAWSVIVGHVRAMCRALSRRGLPAIDLIVGQDASDILLANTDFQKLVDKNSGILIASPIVQELTKYDGVSLLGVVNFGGYRLNVIVVDEQYGVTTEQNGVKTTTYYNYFPAKGIMVTAPGCGHLMYAHIVHMDDAGDVETITGKRVPDLFVDRRKKKRELILEARPLAAPKNYSPWVYAADAVN
ncbi:MAG: major capsid protein [Oscillospiraceae bacterium]|nr:major capsid protein [Oscillospiraceae bacterium]